MVKSSKKKFIFIILEGKMCTCFPNLEMKEKIKLENLTFLENKQVCSLSWLINAKSNSSVSKEEIFIFKIFWIIKIINSFH